MSSGQFIAHLNDCWRLLDLLELGYLRNPWPKYYGKKASDFRGKSYSDVWKTCYGEQLFDFLFVDMALVQFRYDPNVPDCASYSFLECPFETPSYEDFLSEQLQTNIPSVGYEFWDYYETFLQEQPPKESVTPIRYDSDPGSYNPGYHPAAHFHFGHKTATRICSLYLLRPVSFLLFVIRQRYPQWWGKILNNHTVEPYKTHLRSIREELDEVDSQFMNTLDNYEYRLS